MGRLKPGVTIKQAQARQWTGGVKEFGLKDTIKVTLASLAIAFSLGGLAHLLFTMH